MLTACSESPPSSDGSGPPPKKVVVHTVGEREFVDRIEALGTARANEATLLTPNVAEKITDIRFRDGAQVNKGDILLRLDDRSERAELAAARARLSERQDALARAQDLAAQRVVSEAEVDLTRSELATAEAEVEAVAAHVEDRTIRAPFDGVIGLRTVSLGALIAPGDPIATLADIDTIKADFTIPARRYSLLQPGLPIRATTAGLPDRVYEGTIDSLDNEVDPVTRTITARALIDNKGRALRPGMLLEIELLAERRRNPAVPEAALMPRGDAHFVVVIIDNTAEQREVRLGMRTPGWAEILDGVAVGEQVVTRGAQGLSDGSAVEILPPLSERTQTEPR
ncbi:efflux RND transporter periplasmic adaptor subunit [Algiphilus sp.]|uniref:efflux RND transporter periplasmic adaptor subunit n=1 Tax=Algiphilus sp. TaxID=1872431 RepID=UPI003B5213F4